MRVRSKFEGRREFRAAVARGLYSCPFPHFPEMLSLKLEVLTMVTELRTVKNTA